MIAVASLQRLKLSAALCRHPYSSLSCLASSSVDPAGGGSREILTSSSKGGFFSWSRQPVAAKQQMLSSLPWTSIRRKFLKSGGSLQPHNLGKSWRRGLLPRTG